MVEAAASPAFASTDWISLLLAGLALFLLLDILGCIMVYNRLVRLRQTVCNAFSQIDVQLKRRHDLIPALLETVKGYMAHERATLEAVAHARTLAGEALAGVRRLRQEELHSVSEAESRLTNSMIALVALLEGYPQLRADRPALDLMEELRTTENRIAFARQHTNDAIRQFNICRGRFPNNLVAGPMGFTDIPYLDFADRSIEHAPDTRLR
ncbi:LemA family protein [Megalodesulfovibrio paquesii]